MSAGTGAVTFGSTVGAIEGAGEPDGDRSDDAGRQRHDSGAQSYNSAVTLGATDTLTTTNAAIDFAAQITGGTFSLTLTSGTGGADAERDHDDRQPDADHDRDGHAGYRDLHDRGRRTYAFAAVTTNGTLTLGQATMFGAVTLGSTTTIDSTNTAVDFTSTVDATTAGCRPDGERRDRGGDVRRRGWRDRSRWRA